MSEPIPDQESKRPARRMLTPAEVETLPAGIRPWYEEHDGLRDRADLPVMPERVRATFERLTARSGPLRPE